LLVSSRHVIIMSMLSQIKTAFFGNERKQAPPSSHSSQPRGSDTDEATDDDDDDRAWPMKAFHAENYFGYTFDAGDHRIYRYQFKADADTSIVPPYGGASCYSTGW